MFLFSKVYDIIIVGGGISGLFLAYKLRESNLSILLIEQHKELGGRIHTIKDNGIQYECAAARFNENHVKLLSLIKELELYNNLIKLPKNVKKILRKYDTNIPLNTQYLYDIVRKEYVKYDNVYLQNITFYSFLVELFDSEVAEYLKDSMGYDSEFMYLNAHAAIKMFKDDLFTSKEYFVLSSGLSSIMEKMENELKSYKHVTILKNNKLTKIFDDHIITSVDKYFYKNLVLGIPKYELQKLEEFKDFKLLDTVKPIQLLRIYFKYPVNNGVWFKDIPRTTTNNYIRHIIPIDPSNGLIMISYTDGDNAKLLESIYYNGEKSLIKSIHKEIKKLFDITPPEPLKVYFHNWDEKYAGCHFWKPGENIDTIYSKILQPDINKNIFICGEAYSKKQAWVEGALETAYDVLKNIKLENITVKTNIDEEEHFVDVPLDKTYSIDEVLKHNNWIIIELDGYKKIYDVSKWIPFHPGGDTIKKGIDANIYYKDFKGKSPTDYIRNISEYHLSSVRNKLVNSKYITYVGLLK